MRLGILFCASSYSGAYQTLPRLSRIITYTMVRSYPFVCRAGYYLSTTLRALFVRARIAALMRRYPLKAEQLRTRSTRLFGFSESASLSTTLRALVFEYDSSMSFFCRWGMMLIFRDNPDNSLFREDILTLSFRSIRRWKRRIDQQARRIDVR